MADGRTKSPGAHSFNASLQKYCYFANKQLYGR